MNATDNSFLSVAPLPTEEQIIAMPVAKLIAYVLKVYGALVLLLFGLPGNCLSYFVMKQAQFHNTTTSFFIRVLAVCDIGYLISRCLHRVLLVTFLRPLLVEWNALRVFCVEYLCMARFTQAASRYVLLLMTYDRLLALVFPFQARTYPIMKIAKRFTLFMLLLSFLEGSTYFFTSESKLYANWLCPYFFSGILGDISVMYDNVTVYTTCILLVIANVVIAWSLSRHAQRMKSVHDEGGAQSNVEALQQRSVQNRQISLMLLLISWFFVLSNIPREAYHQFWPRHTALARSRPDLNSLSLEIFLFVEGVNYAINFYLYVASCRKFRMSLKKIFVMSGEKKSKTTVTSTMQ